MKTAVLRFVPAYTPHLLDDPRLVRQLMVERGALTKVKLDEPIPVVVDHDLDRQIGTVRSIDVWDDVMPGAFVAPWFFAHVDLEDPPEWLKRGGGVSWSHRNVHSMEIAGTTLLRSAIIDEVSILTPSTQPAEPLAQVWYVGEEQTSRAEAGEIIGGQRIVRHNSGKILGVR